MKVSFQYTWFSRIMLLLYVLYLQVFSYVYNNSLISMGLLAIALFMQLFEDGFVLRGRAYLWLLGFAMAGLVISAFVSVDVSLSFTYLFRFLEYVIMFYLVHRYCMIDGSIRYSALLFVVVSVVMALMNLAFDIGEERMTFSENLNVNAVGVVCSFGIAFLLYLLIDMKKKPLLVALVFALLLLLSFVVVKTVSKKAMIFSGVLVTYWLLFCYRQVFGEQNILKRVLLFIVLIVGVVFAYRWFLYREVDTYQYMKHRFELMNITGGTSAEMRYRLIQMGFMTFIEHPVFGVGINNFRFYNEYGSYAHCFYAELLACTGIVGGFLLGIPIIRALTHYFALLRNRKIVGVACMETKYMLALFVSFLVLQWTQILFYEMYLMYAFALVTAYIEVLDDNLRMATHPLRSKNL